MIEVDLLGPLAVRAGGLPVTLEGRRERAVLANLACRAGQHVAMSTLVAAVWGAEPPRTAHKAVQTAVANIRRTLREAAPAAAASLVTVDGGYRLAVEPEAVDALRFELDLAAGHGLLATDPVAAAERLAAARAAWHGDEPAHLGDGVDATVARGRFVALRVDAEAAWLDAQVRAGRHDQVLTDLAAACEAWPLRERFHQLHMLALYRAGRQSEAVAVFRRLREQLVDVGIEPSEATRQLEVRILEQAASLDAPPPALQPERAQTTPASAAESSPRRAPELVGRDGDVAAIIDLLARHPVVALVGTGGVGKTTLARAVVAAAEGWSEVAWCRLGAVTEAASLVPTIATALGLPPQAGITVREAVVARLAPRRVLVVLDNCEHVLASSADVVAELVDRCPQVSLLVTSRERLGVASEVVRPVEPLDLPVDGQLAGSSSAVQLFVRRAQQADPRFHVDAQVEEDAGKLCRALDGLPLAIELAAARVRALTVQQIAAHLHGALDLLGDVEGTGRHSNLRRAVAWSHDLLGTAQQQIFRRLAIFAGSFSLPAAVTVARDDTLGDDRLTALLADLVDKSMVVVEHVDGVPARYHLLETLRAYGREQLDHAGERTDVERRFLAFQRTEVAALVDRCRSVDEPAAILDVEAGFDNIRQAVELAEEQGAHQAWGELVGGIGRILLYRIRWEIGQWAAEAHHALSSDVTVTPNVRAEVAAALAWSHWYAGEFDRAHEVISAASGGHASDDPSGGLLTYVCAIVAMYRQDPDVATIGHAAVARAREAGDSWLEVAGLAGEAMIAHYGGSRERAELLLEEGRDVEERGVSPSASAMLRYAMAEVSGEADPDRTIALAREAAALADLTRSHVIEGIARVTALTVSARHRDVAVTLPEFVDLIDRFRRDAAWTHVLMLVWNLVEALHRLGLEDDLVADLAVLLHARPPGIPAPYGEQLARLDVIRDSLHARLASGGLDAAKGRANGMSRDAIADLAADLVDRVSARHPG